MFHVRILAFVTASLVLTTSARAQEAPFEAEKGAGDTLKVQFDAGAAFLRTATDWTQGIHVDLVDGGIRTPLALKPITTEPTAITATYIQDPAATFKEPALIGMFFVPAIKLELADPFPASGAVMVTLPGGVFATRVQGKFVDIAEATVTVTDTKDGSITNAAELAAALDETRSDQRFTIQGGDGNGIIDFHGSKHLVGLGSGLLDFQASVEGSLALDEAQRFDYFNDLEASIDGYRTFRYSLFGSNETYGEFGLHYTFDADQKLENADNVLGLKFATVIRDPVTGLLNDLLVPKDTAGGYPLWVLRADYVKEALEDSATAGTKPDTSDGDVRATMNVDWSVPIGRDMGWDFLPQLGTIDKLDLDCAYEATWDFDESEYLDNLKLSLRFATRASAEGTSTAFDITWAKGEEGPIFNDVEALFAGITLSR